VRNKERKEIEERWRERERERCREKGNR